MIYLPILGIYIYTIINVGLNFMVKVGEYTQLLMVQKSCKTPKGCIKPIVNNEINYQPQLVSRISAIKLSRYASPKNP